MSQYFVFTTNNPTQEQENFIKKFAALYCDHLLIGKEIAPTTGTPHFQGCFKTSKQWRLTSIIKETTGNMNNVQCCKKIYKANINYCRKNGIYWEFGKENSKPKQNEYDEAYQLALEGKFDQISRKLIIKHGPKFEKIYLDSKKPENLYLENQFGNFFKNHFLWIQGPTGTGKSFFAYHFKTKINRFFEKYCKINHVDLIQYDTYEKLLNKWFDNYKEWCQISGSKLKRWCDQTPFPVEVKGASFKSIRPMFIIITSNYSMEECFTKDGILNEKDFEPMQRRCTELKINSRNDKINWPDYNMFSLYLNTHLYVRHQIITKQIEEIDKELESVDFKNASTSTNITLMIITDFNFDTKKCYCIKCYQESNSLFCNECNTPKYDNNICNGCKSIFIKISNEQYCKNCILKYKDLYNYWNNYQKYNQLFLEYNNNIKKQKFKNNKEYKEYKQKIKRINNIKLHYETKYDNYKKENINILKGNSKQKQPELERQNAFLIDENNNSIPTTPKNTRNSNKRTSFNDYVDPGNDGGNGNATSDATSLHGQIALLSLLICLLITLFK
ncbi:hypothetical protein PIROE2DRAFT_1235 [Piromyces sp. E2]|nr:hypothetical protein PIROE2DRAFT_1235 [Piromyces sp. E2]|eukprot:OUM70685.1 hypothetical protein PIROE2DRAFT_1235 [Piromyces sp. E2]